MPDTISIELAYAAHSKNSLLSLTVEQGTTVAQAISLSGILQAYPEIDLAVNKVGIFSHITPLDTVLQAGDRIEIYRPLSIDPKEARRRRAEKAKQNHKT